MSGAIIKQAVHNNGSLLAQCFIEGCQINKIALKNNILWGLFIINMFFFEKIY
jgi:hypothetical protein